MNELANKTIDALGGTSVVAEMCDIRPPSVSEWRKAGIPKPWLRWFKCIRPDIFEPEGNNRRPEQKCKS